ncbi:MAG: FAD-binding oxidoreductase [Gemmatimonadaceae bacterium]
MATEAVASAIRRSGEARTSLRIAGRGTWLDAGRPVRADQTVSLADDRGVVSYVPGDLTLTVRAGTSLAEVERITSDHDQWLPLDPYGSDDGTIGATIATGSAGPLASTFGLPRDLLLGVEFVNGRGEIVRAGGRVVKNVAGFDLSRLLTGSWGTLGVITEVTLRLYARPRADRTFAVPLRGSEKERTALIHAMHASLSPFSLLLIGPTVARALGLEDSATCVVRLGGNEAAVAVQLRALSQNGGVKEVATDTWTKLRGLESDAHSVIRISSLPLRMIAAAARILADDMSGIYTSIDPRRGVMRIVTRPHDSGDSGTTLAAAADWPTNGESSTVIFEKLSPDIWSQVSPTVVDDALSRGIKKAYDPFNILNPGILGD